MIHADLSSSIAETSYTSTTLSSMRTHTAIVNLSSEVHQVDGIKTGTKHADNWRQLCEDMWSGDKYEPKNGVVTATRKIVKMF